MKLKLHFEIQHYCGPYLQVQGEDTAFRVIQAESVRFGNEVLVELTPLAVEKFIAIVNELEIWSWPGSCEPDGVCLDGTSWELLLSVNNKTVKSSGLNAYPFSSTPQPSAAFECFVNSVCDLVNIDPLR